LPSRQSTLDAHEFSEGSHLVIVAEGLVRVRVTFRHLALQRHLATNNGTVESSLALAAGPKLRIMIRVDSME
jgi:hypothetical protein